MVIGMIERVRMDEIADVTKLAGFEFTKYMEYIPDGEIITVRALNLKNGSLVLDDVRRIERSVSDSLTRSKLYVNDIVLSYTGTIGETAQITENNRYHLAPNVAKIAPDISKINPQYLFLYIRSDEFKQQMLNHAHGSTQMTVPMKVIRELTVPICERSTQDKIASILVSIDRKIENNKRINDNLQQQAQAIYASMFITNADPAWTQGHLSDLITVKYGKDHKKLADGVYPVFGSGGIMRYVERPLYTGESVLIPRKGTLNNVMYVNEPFWSVDTMFYTEMKVPNVAKFVFHFVKAKDLASMNAGSAVPSMTTDILNALELAIPPAERLAEFESVVAPMYQAMQANSREAAKLAELRDTLLPRLMSGEIDVSDIQI